jgi:hypothetical protein
VRALAAAALVLAACGSEAPASSEPPVWRASGAIVGGAASPASEDAVVLLRNPRGDCTATLIAPNLVVTARHCVSSANRAMTCDERGATLAGGQSGVDYEPSKLAVYVGATLARAGALPPAALGRQIVHDGSPTLCDHDLAVVTDDPDVVGDVDRADARAAPPRVGAEGGGDLPRRGVGPRGRRQSAHVARVARRRQGARRRARQGHHGRAA